MSAVSPDLLQRFDIPGPRYTSYPTADRFVEAFGADDYIQALKQRRTGMAKAMAMPLSLYVHIPFCESLATTAPATRSSPSTIAAQRNICAISAARSICMWPM